MNETNLRVRLNKILDDADEAALIQQLVDSARESARMLVKLWVEGDEDTSDQAFLVLTGLEEQLVIPVVERLPQLAPSDAVRALDIAIEAELRLRQRIAATLYALTENRTELPTPPPLGPVEVPPPRLRVCDEAYLKMRRLLHFGEDDLGYTVERDTFLRWPMEKRDEAIAAARASGEWNRLAVGSDD